MIADNPSRTYTLELHFIDHIPDIVFDFKMLCRVENLLSSGHEHEKKVSPMSIEDTKDHLTLTDALCCAEL